MTTKIPTLQIFMTDVDEVVFSGLLKAHIPSIKFIDSFLWSSPVPAAHDSMAECHGHPFSNVVILDEAICTVERYAREFVAPHPGGGSYMGGNVGPGMIQVLRSREAGYAPQSLRDGRLTASYDPNAEPAMDAFVKAVWKIFKKFSQKTYLINPETGVVSEEPETRFFAGPDAAAQFDGSSGNYLMNSAFVYFVAESVKCGVPRKGWNPGRKSSFRT
ncbi:Uncharacterised protein [Burkholderia cepacia]|uniref:Uncharacterized protein n=1 Tax=Burkholderia cepacia TaxID=292 RepID=A0AAE8T1I4_BURCE|nr:hypothetical protein [Burkholderia cepacia]POM17564.1 hypothetical protein CSX04_05862 [Burkholderia cepacia]SPV16016.1 Uncharacterised protein [Burkholderia cepacia]